MVYAYTIAKNIKNTENSEIKNWFYFSAFRKTSWQKKHIHHVTHNQRRSTICIITKLLLISKIKNRILYTYTDTIHSKIDKGIYRRERERERERVKEQRERDRESVYWKQWKLSTYFVYGSNNGIKSDDTEKKLITR